MGRAKEANQKEIGRIKLSNTRELVASLVDGEKLDLRVWWTAITTKDGQSKAFGFIFLMITGLSLRGSLIR